MSTVMEPPKKNAAADYTTQILNLVKAKNQPNPNSTKPSWKSSIP